MPQGALQLNTPHVYIVIRKPYKKTNATRGITTRSPFDVGDSEHIRYKKSNALRGITTSAQAHIKQCLQ